MRLLTVVSKTCDNLPNLAPMLKQMIGKGNWVGKSAIEPTNSKKHNCAEPIKGRNLLAPLYYLDHLL